MNVFDGNTHLEKEHLSIRVREPNKEEGGFDDGVLTHYATVQDVLSGMKKHSIQKSLVMPNTVTVDKMDAKKSSEMIAKDIVGLKNLVGGAAVQSYTKTSADDPEEGVLEN